MYLFIFLSFYLFIFVFCIFLSLYIPYIRFIWFLLLIFPLHVDVWWRTGTEFRVYNFQASSLRVFAGNEDENDLIEVSLGGWRGAGVERLWVFTGNEGEICLHPPSLPSPLLPSLPRRQRIPHSWLYHNMDLFKITGYRILHWLSYNSVKPCWLHKCTSRWCTCTQWVAA